MDNHKLDIDEMTILLEDGGYVHFHFKKCGVAIGLPILKLALSFMKENLNEKRCLLVTTEEGSTLTQEAREFASSEAFDELVKADAIVRTNYSHEMAANFFIRFNKPNRPVKLFPNKEKALDWIAEQINT